MCVSRTCSIREYMIEYDSLGITFGATDMGAMSFVHLDKLDSVTLGPESGRVKNQRWIYPIYRVACLASIAHIKKQ